MAAVQNQVVRQSHVLLVVVPVRYICAKGSLPFSRHVLLAMVAVRSLKTRVTSAMGMAELRSQKHCRLRSQQALIPVTAFAYRAKVKQVSTVHQQAIYTFKYKSKRTQYLSVKAITCIVKCQLTSQWQPWVARLKYQHWMVALS
ncbi:Uncharacterised protein [Yersinia enterocolitica]|nr:Uncharacterised protein [Yersinia enterocolitica]